MRSNLSTILYYLSLKNDFYGLYYSSIGDIETDLHLKFNKSTIINLESITNSIRSAIESSNNYKFVRIEYSSKLTTSQ